MNKDKICNWLSINLPENCPNVCISFKREIVEAQIKDFGAKPLYGLDGRKEEWLPVEIFITYGGLLAPDQRLHELKEKLKANQERISEYELSTRYRKAYEKIQKEIAELEKSIGEK